MLEGVGADGRLIRGLLRGVELHVKLGRKTAGRARGLEESPTSPNWRNLESVETDLE
ncbi:MAG: hypothetical protein ACE5IJ_11750 [Thermoplasmata archaeon]